MLGKLEGLSGSRMEEMPSSFPPPVRYVPPAEPPAYSEPAPVPMPMQIPVQQSQLTVNVAGTDPNYGGASLVVSLSIGGMILGVLSLLFVCVPFVGFGIALIAMTLSVSGMLLSAKRQWQGLGFAIVGATISLIGIGAGGYVTYVSAQFAAALSDVEQKQRRGK
jgi:hypothetical protein